jgi:enoyl-CoA hydratase
VIQAELRDRVALLRIARHAQRNAMDLQHCEDLVAAIDKAEADGARVIVLTGEGSSFCAGADLDTVREPEFRASLTRLTRRLADVPVPVIAAVNGPAIGAGTQLAASCDLRVAAPTARFAVPTAKLGLAVDAWSVRRLISLAGGGVTRAMLIGVETLDATRAHAVGLVDRLGEIDDALAWAEELAALAPMTLAFYKRVTNAICELDVDDEEFRAAMVRCFDSEDSKEAKRARAERRAPSFQGR